MDKQDSTEDFTNWDLTLNPKKQNGLTLFVERNAVIWTKALVRSYLGDPKSEGYLDRRRALFKWQLQVDKDPNHNPLQLNLIKAFLENNATKNAATAVITPFALAHWDGLPKDIKFLIASYLPRQTISRLMQTSKANKALLEPFLVQPRFAYHIKNCDIDLAKPLLANNREAMLRDRPVFFRDESPTYLLALLGEGLPGGKAFYDHLCSQYANNDPEVSKLMYCVISCAVNTDELIGREQLQAETFVRERLMTRPDLIVTPSLHGPSALQQFLIDYDPYGIEDLLRPHLLNPKTTAWFQQEAAEEFDQKIQAHEAEKDTWDDKKQWKAVLLELKHQRWIARTSVFIQGLSKEMYAKVRKNIHEIKPAWFYDKSVITDLCHRLITLTKKKRHHEAGKVFCTLQQLIRTSMPRGSVADCYFVSGRPNKPRPNYYDDVLPHDLRYEDGSNFYELQNFRELGRSFFIYKGLVGRAWTRALAQCREPRPPLARWAVVAGRPTSDSAAIIRHYKVRPRQVNWFKRLPELQCDLGKTHTHSPLPNPAGS